jgi:hypothetical protein
MTKHGGGAMTLEEAMRRLDAMRTLLATIAQGLADEEQLGAAEAADHPDDRLCRLTRLMDGLAAEEKLLRLAIDGMATSGGRRPTRNRKPNSRYPAADWTSSSSPTGDNGADAKPRRAVLP